MTDYSDCCFMLFDDNGNAIDAFEPDPNELARWSDVIRGRLTFSDPCGVVVEVSSSLHVEETTGDR